MSLRELRENNTSSHGETALFLRPNINIWKIITLTFLLISISNETFAQGYSFYKELTIQSNHVFGGPHNDFPVMIKHADNDLRHISFGGHVQQNQGQDIEFRDETGMIVLDYEIESYLPTTGYIVAWVKVPIIVDNANTVIRMYYGNALAVLPVNNFGTWSNGYKAVYHLNDNLYNESSGNVGALTSTGTAVQDGIFANGVEVNAIAPPNNQYLESVNEPDLKITGDLTLDIWVNLNSLLSGSEFDNVLFSMGKPGDQPVTNYLYYLSLDCLDPFNKKIRAFWEQGSGTNINTTTNTPIILNAGDWTKITMVRDAINQEVSFYQDGVQVGSKIPYIENPTNGNQTYLRLGNDQYDETNTLDGILDEARISDVIRTDGWIITEYNSQRTLGTFDILADILAFYEIGSQESLCANPPEIVSAIVTNTTTCGGNDGLIILNFNNVPDAFYDILANGSLLGNIQVTSGSGELSGLSAGNYNDLRITLNDCSNVNDVDVIVNDPTSPTISVVSSTKPNYCGESSGTISLSFTDVPDGDYFIIDDT